MKKLGLALLVCVACGSSEKSSVGTKVHPQLSPDRQAELGVVQSKLAAVKDLDANGFAAKYSLPFSTAPLGYEPLKAAGYDRVKASALGPNAAEEATLAANGFLITDRNHFPSFVYGYHSIYRDDLPVYVSADSVLFAVHKSFDAILASIEQSTLLPKLAHLCASMRAALAAGAANDLPAEARGDVDLFLSVGLSLLDGSFAAPVAGGDASAARSLFEGAQAASGASNVKLFGVPRDVDFSQFKPRGHYTDSQELSRYFQASMWFGRIELRTIETQPDHTQVFMRRQLEGAYVLRALMNADAFAEWKLIDETITGMVGEHDNMTVPELDSLLADLKLAKAADLATKSDAEIAQAIVAGNYGGQRISSQIMINGLNGGTMPLSYTFLLLGQRYTIDSHVFSNVVWDRVARTNFPMRMMPNPLDVAFAALGNGQAGMLLGEELTKYGYAPDLASMRVLADEHPAEFWDSSLYNQWLSMQRALSPSADVVANPNAAGLPKITGTEAWGRRILSTQLASWTELRHDTVLYVKQSYTGGAACEYPDAYVEPYPELFARVAAFATKGATLTAGLPSAAQYGAYFERLRATAATLEGMAKNQRTGAPHTAEQLAFINSLVFHEAGGCGAPDLTYDGWYAKLFWDPASALEVDSLVADVHTQPTDEAGNSVGKILHVGTWYPREMVVTIESCSGPRAYVGLVSSYHELITENYQRLNDEEWRAKFISPTGGFATPPEVPWLSGLVAAP